MSRWAEAFRSSARRSDTADTAPPNPPPGPAISAGSVNTVSSVTGRDSADAETVPSESDELSAVSAMSRAGEASKVDAPGGKRPAVPGPTISPGYLRAARRLPPSWSDPTTLPPPGSFCSCCKGQRWWSERDAPKGWRCAACHPPDHLASDAMTEVLT
jgi:hypothetical protein